MQYAQWLTRILRKVSNALEWSEEHHNRSERVSLGQLRCKAVSSESDTH